MRTVGEHTAISEHRVVAEAAQAVAAAEFGIFSMIEFVGDGSDGYALSGVRIFLSRNHKRNYRCIWRHGLGAFERLGEVVLVQPHIGHIFQHYYIIFGGEFAS